MQRIEALSTNATNQRSRTALLGNIQLNTTPIWNFRLKCLLTAVQTSNSGAKDDVQWPSAGPKLLWTVADFSEQKESFLILFMFLFGFGPEISNGFNWLLGVDGVDSSLENRTGPNSLGLETTGPVDLECQQAKYHLKNKDHRFKLFETIYFPS